MMDFSTWIAFTAASLVLSAAPGPDNLFVLAQSAVYGKKAGLIVVLGLCTGLVINTLAAALGIAALVAAFPALFWAIRLAGAVYLFHLAVMAWRHAASGHTGTGCTPLSGAALWRRGLIMNLTNPKVQIFFLAFFPQFVNAGTEGLALAGQMLLQGVTFIGVTALVFGAVAWGAGTMADRLRSPAFQTWLGRCSALILALLAIFTLTT